MVTFLSYHNPIKTGNITLSIDNIVLDLHISNPAAREELMHLLENLPITHAVEVTHWDSFRIGSFREQFTIRFQDGNSLWVGAVLNGRKPEWGRVRLDFNPNKVANHRVFQMVLVQCVSSTRPMHRKIRRYDLAVDIPVLRQDAFLVKDSRAYIERRHGQEWTQYLGAKSSTVGRVKLYNKQVEAGLHYPLTRLEMTLDQLGRRTREKINVLMADHVKAVEISRNEYEQMISQVKGYVSGKVETAVVDQDQPPPQGMNFPAWVREAEASEEMLT